MWDSSRNNFERDLAIVIGINNYQNGIHPLSTAVNDATALAELLETDYNYQEVIRLFPPHGEATLESLKELLSETLSKEIKPTEGDRLLFYFAGHGIARNSEDGPAGYLVPQDAQLGKLETFLPMRDLNTALSQLECHHLLVMLDCCFAGNFRWSSSRNVIPVPETIHREHYDRFIRFRAWQAITSAAHNQEAIDFLSDLRDGANNSHHSPFALALIEGLKDIKADLTGDGVITAPELYLYLRDRLLSKDGYSELQTPGLWPLQKHERGEFIFTPPGFQRDQLKPAPPLNEDNNPYRGLQPYDEKHARFFFGRQELIEELYNKISSSAQSSSQLIAVLGISGSGKSSLVKAGLIPYLRKHHEKEWQILEPMRPGKSPFIALANTISAIANVPSDANSHYFKQLIRDFKQGNSQQLIETIAAWSNANPQVKLLLTIDQFEELITMSRKVISANSDPKSDSIKQKPQDWLSKVFSRQSTAKNNNQTAQEGDIQQEWQQFLVLLINTLKNCPQLHIVLILRSDFEARFVESALKEYWEQARFPVRAMRSDELREAIEKPASEMALYFEPANAVDRLIDEVGEMPGALPLLSFTLSEFYIKLHQAWSEKRKEDRAVTVDEQFYQQGGIAGSLTHRANEIYDSLPDDAHGDTMRRVMLRMVSIEGGEVTRRRVAESELMYPNPKENKRKEKVIDRFVNARLLVKGRERGEAYVEPAHDFFIRGWDKIQTWTKEEQENLTLQQLLLPAARDWLNNKKTIGALWDNNPRILLLKQVLESKDNWLNQLETDFVKLSLQRKRNNLRRLVGSVTATILILSGLTIFAFNQLRQAQSRQVEQLAATAGLSLPTQPVEATINALAAINLSQSPLVQFPNNSVSPSVYGAVLDSVRLLREQNRLEEANVNSVAFSPDSRRIVSGSTNRTVQLWDAKTGKQIGSPMIGHQKGVYSVAFSPDGKTIVSGSWDKTVRLWDAKTGKQISSPMIGHQEGVHSVAFSPDGKQIVSGSFDKTVRLWDAQTQKPIGSPLIGHQDWVYSVAFSPDGRTIVSGSNDKSVRLWDALTQKPIGSPMIGHELDVNSVAFSPDGKTIVSGSNDKTVRLWDAQTQKQIDFPLTGYQYYTRVSPIVSSVAFSPDGKTIVSGSWDNTVRLWDTVTGKPIGSPLKGHQERVYSVAFSRDGKQIVSGSWDSTVRLWDAITQKPIGSPMIGHESYVNSVAFSPDGKKIVSGSLDKTVRLWDAITQKQIGSPMIGHDDEVNSVAFSPDGKTIVSGSSDNTVWLWDAITQKPIASPMIGLGHDDEVTSVAFSRDGKTIVSGSKDRAVHLWDVQTRIQIDFSLLGSEYVKGYRDELVSVVAFSPDGKTIVSGNLDQSVQLWDAITQKPIGSPLTGHKSAVMSVAFSPDGKQIVSGSGEGMRLWGDISLEGLLHRACEQLRNHSVLVQPQTDAAREAKQTCKRY